MRDQNTHNIRDKFDDDDDGNNNKKTRTKRQKVRLGQIVLGNIPFSWHTAYKECHNAFSFELLLSTCSSVRVCVWKIQMVEISTKHTSTHAHTQIRISIQREVREREKEINPTLLEAGPSAKW